MSDNFPKLGLALGSGGARGLAHIGLLEVLENENIENGEHIIIKEGSVAEAVRASIAVPGIFIPFDLNGIKLVNGGLVDPVPASSCYNLGADVVIGVNVNLKKIDNQINNIFDVLLNTFYIMQLKLNSKRNYQVDLMLRPELNELSAYDLDKAEVFIEAVRKAAENSLDKIIYLLKEDNYEKK